MRVLVVISERREERERERERERGEEKKSVYVQCGNKHVCDCVRGGGV